MTDLAENNQYALKQGENDKGAALTFDSEEERAALTAFHAVTEKNITPEMLEKEMRPIFESGLQPMFYTTQGERERMEDSFSIDVTSTRTAGDVVTFLEKTFDQIAPCVANKVPRLHPDHGPGGTTANVCYLSADSERTITVANAGDSRTVLFIRNVATGHVEAQRLSYDHKAADPREKARAEKAGGIVTDNETGIRLNDNTLATRGFGNEEIAGFTCTPEITQHSLRSYIHNPAYEVYVCTSCDGLYERSLSEKDYATAMAAFLPAGKRSEELASGMVMNLRLAHLFCNLAQAVGSGDNLTAIVTRFSATQSKDIIIGMFDGSSGDDRYLGAELSGAAATALSAAAKPLKWRLVPSASKTGQSGGRSA